MLRRFPTRLGAMSSTPAFQENQERLRIWAMRLSRQDISLSGVFSDADGDALTITADTSDFEVAEAILFQGTLTVIAVADGSATITVTAEDSDGNVVSDEFDVTVMGPPSPVANLRCIAETGRVAFLWDAPEWSGGETYDYNYDYELTP